MFRLILTLLFILIGVEVKAEKLYQPVRIEYVEEIGAIWVHVQYTHHRHIVEPFEKSNNNLKKKYGIHYLEDYIKVDEEGIVTEINKIKQTFTFLDKKMNIIINPLPGNVNTNGKCGAHIGADLSIFVNEKLRSLPLTLIPQDCNKGKVWKAVVINFELDSDVILVH